MTHCARWTLPFATLQGVPGSHQSMLLAIGRTQSPALREETPKLRVSLFTNLEPNLSSPVFTWMFSPGDSLVSAPPSLCTSFPSEAPIKVREEQPKFNFNCSCSNSIFPDLSSLAATQGSFLDPFNALDFRVILHFGFLPAYLFLVTFPVWLDIYPLLEQQSSNIQSS